MRPRACSQHEFKVNFGNLQYFSSPQADWNQENENAIDFIKNKPKLVAGENIVLDKENNTITISAMKNPDDPENPGEVVPMVPTNIDLIINNKLPIFFGENDFIEQIPFTVQNKSEMAYTDQGLYREAFGSATSSAGYSIIISPAMEADSKQSIFLWEDLNIVNSYQYSEILATYLEMGFDGTYWYEDGTIDLEINDQVFTFKRYSYNKDLIGAPIESTEYWRFELEVVECLE